VSCSKIQHILTAPLSTYTAPPPVSRRTTLIQDTSIYGDFQRFYQPAIKALHTLGATDVIQSGSINVIAAPDTFLPFNVKSFLPLCITSVAPNVCNAFIAMI
jgi:hypothetical protein